MADFKKVYLFISCLVDNFFPEVGEAMVRLLYDHKIKVEFLEDQTCCGQPAFNSGYADEARGVAKHFLNVFDGIDGPIVCPSGSCISMVKVYYRDLFKNDPDKLKKAEIISENIFEFTDFIFNKLGIKNVNSSYKGKVTFHDSCHALRELGLKDEPRQLLKSISGVEYVEMEMCDACCGFGGTFSIKYPEVSVSMLEEKIDSILKSGADTVVSTDMGCLMNIKGLVSRRNLPIKVMHIAELLAFK
ncbi:MAG: (Fe-S)-binding protein [Thermodesulfobacteriota bacterium]